MSKEKTVSSIQAIFEPPQEGKVTLPPQITLKITHYPSPEFVQGLQCNPADIDVLFDMFSEELEKLRAECKQVK